MTHEEHTLNSDVPVSSSSTLGDDLIAGLVVFLVALPLCLGIALASGAPLFSGLLAGIIGGLIVGCVSGSHSSVSGPAAGLTAIVAAQITSLGFEAFLLAVLIGGLLQSRSGGNESWCTFRILSFERDQGPVGSNRCYPDFKTDSPYFWP